GRAARGPANQTRAGKFRLEAAKERGPVGVAILDPQCLYQGKMQFRNGWVYVCLGGHKPGDRGAGNIPPINGRATPYRTIGGIFNNGYYYIDYLDRTIGGMPKAMP